ncbi:fimbrial protein [Cronobacter turicensis]|uniref:fimbrial protein n=1 Tax=Cronobacter turicensis TaxID=413502 RepID=UPI0024AF764F|nr:fimbrial protein [Cronobacter turicensis]MDI7419433.1 fimbrial protein [Cronobacter turicensis]MDI7498305.1 fimbrial protein [Cronobacter turicensis]
MRIILFLLVNCMACSCFAGCIGYPTLTDSFSFDDVVVQRDLPIGSTIKSVNFNSTGGAIGECDGSAGHEFEEMTYGAATSISHVYATNLPGVGIRIYLWKTEYAELPARTRALSNALVRDGISSADYHIADLVKTGDITSGQLTPGQVAKVYFDENPAVPGLVIQMGNSSVTQVACSITTPNLNFPIGDVPVSKFGTSPGTIPVGAQSTQNLGLDCEAGANINVSLSGTQNPDVSDTSVLALTGQGSSDVAGGVGVQLLYNESPLKLNNRILLKQSSGGQETFPIIARYYQTKKTVTLGKANASATLDLTYQ